MITILFLSTAVIVGILAAGLAAPLERRVRRPAGGSTGSPRRASEQLPPAQALDVVHLRLSRDGLVWLSPIDGRVMTTGAKR